MMRELLKSIRRPADILDMAREELAYALLQSIERAPGENGTNGYIVLTARGAESIEEIDYECLRHGVCSRPLAGFQIKAELDKFEARLRWAICNLAAETRAPYYR
jgi:hypothetical protein